MGVYGIDFKNINSNFLVIGPRGLAQSKILQLCATLISFNSSEGFTTTQTAGTLLSAEKEKNKQLRTTQKIRCKN